MTIRKLLFRNSLLITVLLAVAIIVQLVLNGLQNKELEIKKTSDSIAHEVAGLIMLTNEWSTFHYDRILEQWKIQNQEVKALVSAHEEYEILENDLVELENGFNELMKTSLQLNQDIPLSQSRILSEKQEWLVTQNQLASQAIIDKTFEISADAMNQLERIQDLSSVLLLAFLIVITVVLFIFSYRIAKKITTPLEAIQKEVQKYEKGNFPDDLNLDDTGSQFNTTQDTSVLARAINAMLQTIRRNLNELQKQNTYIQTILDNVPLGIAVNKFDKGTATYMNKQFEKIYGWPREELFDIENFFEKVYPDAKYREEIQSRIVKDIQSGDPSKMHWEEIEITTQSEGKRIVNVQNIPLIEQNLMISTVQDVTEKIKSQRDRNLIFENSVDMVCTASMDGYLLQLNPAWEKILGWSNEELKAKPFIEFIHPDDLDSTIEATKNLEKGEPALGFENRYLTKDGTYKWLSWNTIPVPEDNILLGIARDVTGSKLTEAELVRSQTLLNQTGNMAKVGGWELDLETMEPFFTEETFRIYELPPGEPPKVEDGINFYAPEARELVTKTVNNAIVNKEPYDIEVPFIAANGKKKWVRTIGQIQLKNNKPVRLYGAIQDITEKKQKEIELKTSEERFRAMIEGAPDPIFIQTNKCFAYLNHHAVKLFGAKTEKELLGKPVLDFFHPDFHQAASERIKKLNVDKKMVHEPFEQILIQVNGTEKWVETKGEPIVYGGENGGLVFIRDITYRKKAEKELKESKALLEKTMNSLNEAVLVINPEDRKIKLVNSAIEKIFGYHPSEIIGENTEVLHLSHKKYKEFGKTGDPLLERHGTFQTEFQMKHKNGSVIETENTVTAIMEDDGWFKGVVSVIRDITQKKESEKKLHEYQQSLKQLTTELSLAEEKQRKEIAANIHDHLSQSLVISKMKINDLQKTEEVKERKAELSVVKNHISEALENSRKITYDLSPPILYEMGLVETMYWLAEKIEEENKIKVDFNSDVAMLELPEAKLILLYRSIQELVYNAIKHSGANKLSIRFNSIHEGLEIILRDNGKGFDLMELEKKKPSTKSFGLFAVQERIQNLGGKFQINSEPGKGTEAKIYLPLEFTKSTGNGN